MKHYSSSRTWFVIPSTNFAFISLSEQTRTGYGGCPISAKYLKGLRPLILKVPRRELEARVGKTQPVSIKPSKPEHVLTSAFLEMLPSHTDSLGPATADIAGDQALDLMPCRWRRRWIGECRAYRRRARIPAT